MRSPAVIAFCLVAACTVEVPADADFLCPSKSACNIDSDPTTDRLNPGDAGWGAGSEPDSSEADIAGSAPGDAAGDLADGSPDTGGGGAARHADVEDDVENSAPEATVCAPGASKCDGQTPLKCAVDGSGWTPQQSCSATGLTCVTGACVDTCGSAPCRWRAVSLPRQAKTCSGPSCPAATVLDIANPWAIDAKIALRAPGGHLLEKTIPAGGSTRVDLPPKAFKLTGWHQSGSGVNVHAFELSAPTRLVVQQLAPPLGNSGGSSDGTTLLAHDRLGTSHVVVTRRHGAPGAPAFVTIIADAKAATTVTVAVTGTVAAGQGVPLLNAGAVYAKKLSAGEVLHLETASVGEDLTGTRVIADHDVAVFSGNAAAWAPDTDRCISAAGKKTCQANGWPCLTDADCPKTCCGDHVEAQIPPTKRLGKHYVSAHFASRGAAKDVWRIVAAEDKTTVQTTLAGTKPAFLNAGEFVEYKAAADVAFTANKAVLVAQFMSGANDPDPNNDECTAKFFGHKACKWHLETLGKPVACSTNAQCPNIGQATDAKVGDPAMAILRPHSSSKTTVSFFVPTGFSASHVALATSGSSAAIDGKPVTIAKGPQAPFGVARVKLKPGLHRITASGPVTGVVHGFDDKVGYALALGGMK